MCIRDSNYIDHVQITAAETVDVGHRAQFYDGVGVMRDMIPVSYTHLRAHETVLDLVCRLLLVKKKMHTGVTEYKLDVSHS